MAEFQISLAEWSVHRAIESGRTSNLDFPRLAREEFGIEAIELVNQLMEGPDVGFIRELRRRADDQGLRVLLLMCDDLGELCALERAQRLRAAHNHIVWLEAAKALGCRAVRVNTGGEHRKLDREDVKRCAEACRELLRHAEPLGLEVLIENHWGLSGDTELLLGLVKEVSHPLFGALPDFGNFHPWVDRYRAIERLMPFAKAVSAKCLDFDDTSGEESTMDFRRLLDLVRASGYRGWLGIEYEGERLDEYEGIRRAKRLIERWMASAGAPSR